MKLVPCFDIPLPLLPRPEGSPPPGHVHGQIVSPSAFITVKAWSIGSSSAWEFFPQLNGSYDGKITHKLGENHPVVGFGLVCCNMLHMFFQKSWHSAYLPDITGKSWG